MHLPLSLSLGILFFDDINEIHTRNLRAISSYTCVRFFVNVHTYTRMMASNESLPPRVKESHRVRFLWRVAHVHSSTSVYPCVEVNARAVRHFSCDVCIRMLTGFTSIHCSRLASYEIRNHGRGRNVVNYTDNVFTRSTLSAPINNNRSASLVKETRI